MSWFSGGFEEASEERERQEKGEFEFANNEKCRFWVTQNHEREIIFLDDFEGKMETNGHEQLVVPFCHHEYKLDLNNSPDSWKNCIYVTDTRGSSPCKPAELNFRRTYFGAMTILDVTPFDDKESGQKIIRPRKKLLMATANALEIIQKKKERKGNLKGWKYTVARHKKMDPRVGSDFEPVEQIEDVPAWLKSHGCPDIKLDPYGFSPKEALDFYFEMFKPMPYDDQQKLFDSYEVRDGNLFRAGNASAGNAPASAGSPSEATIKY